MALKPFAQVLFAHTLTPFFVHKTPEFLFLYKPIHVVNIRAFKIVEYGRFFFKPLFASANTACGV